MTQALRDRLAGSRVNLLYVGRIVPNKRQADLIALFACYQHFIQPQARLILVGSAAHAPSYQIQLEADAQVMGAQSVEFLGPVSDADLAFCYHHASVYVSMSEHEGFGVPLLEAMHCQVPVLAYSAAAVPSTLGATGILCHNKRYDILAEMVDQLVNNKALRERVVQQQTQRAASFAPQLIAAKWQRLIELYMKYG